MFEAEVSVDITAPPEIVYQYLADFRRHPEWSHGLAALEPSDGDAHEVGAEFAATERVPQRFTSFARITALEPARRIAWDAWVPRLMRVEWEIELSPVGDGTRVVQRCRFYPQSLLARALLALVRHRQIPAENRRSLERLCEILGKANRPLPVPAAGQRHSAGGHSEHQRKESQPC
jgi:uncharacterized protein YndB with AHSA1/START domain